MDQPLDTTTDEIRLLNLLPGPDDSQIEATVYLSTLKSSGSGLSTTSYEALSYEWGDPMGPRRNIIVNGEPFEVRENLFQALLALKSIRITGPLWIDAICINQENFHERNHQVRLMGSIYKQASRVRVWIGCSMKEIPDVFPLIPEITTADTSEDAIRQLEREMVKRELVKIELAKIELGKRELAKIELGKRELAKIELEMRELEMRELEKIVLESPRQLNQYSYSSYTGIRDATIFGESLSTNYTMNYTLNISMVEKKKWWDNFANFLEQSYWTRIWIVQEYLLAQSIVIHCGRKTIQNRELEAAICSILHLQVAGYSGELLERIGRSVGKKIIEKRVFRSSRKLVDLIEATRNSKCSDPHDRIYAILGLANDTSKCSFPIDYDRSIFKVKVDIAWFYQQHSTRRDNISRLCTILDEIFADCPDSDY